MLNMLKKLKQIIIHFGFSNLKGDTFYIIVCWEWGGGMAGLSFFSAGLMRDCGIGQKIWRDFGIEKKSGSGLAQKISRDYGKSTKILRDSGIKIVSGSGIETKFIARYGIYDKTGAGHGISNLLLHFFLVTELPYNQNYVSNRVPHTVTTTHEFFRMI